MGHLNRFCVDTNNRASWKTLATSDKVSCNIMLSCAMCSSWVCKELVDVHVA